VSTRHRIRLLISIGLANLLIAANALTALAGDGGPPLPK
jgi:hypothetical protein